MRETLVKSGGDGGLSEGMIGKWAMRGAGGWLGGWPGGWAGGWILGGVLVVVGLVHLAILAVMGQEWEGALSARKPGLFGVSLGVTCWSVVWVAGKLHMAGRQRWAMGGVVKGMVWCLTLEMGLITMQYWRGVPSHFNSGAPMDRLVEGSMLVLILAFMAGLAWMCWRVLWLKGVEKEMGGAMGIAIRWGVWLLMVSCVLGGVTTFVGKANVEAGRQPEVYGEAGVLKFPHGVVLHAVQVLPMLAWMMRRLGTRQPVLLMRLAVAAHLLLLTYAMRQTFMGKGRLDADLFGGVLLGMTGVIVGVILVGMGRGRNAKG